MFHLHQLQRWGFNTGLGRKTIFTRAGKQTNANFGISARGLRIVQHHAFEACSSGRCGCSYFDILPADIASQTIGILTVSFLEPKLSFLREVMDDRCLARASHPACSAAGGMPNDILEGSNTKYEPWELTRQIIDAVHIARKSFAA